MRALAAAAVVLLVLSPAFGAGVPATAAGEPGPSLTLYPHVGGALDGLPGDAEPADPRTTSDAVEAITAPLRVPLELDAQRPIRVRLAGLALAPSLVDVSVRLLDRNGFDVLDASGDPIVIASARLPAAPEMELPVTGPTSIAPPLRVRAAISAVGPAQLVAYGREDAPTSFTLPLVEPTVFAEFVDAERVGAGPHPLTLAGSATRAYRIDEAWAGVRAWVDPVVDLSALDTTMRLYDRAGALVASGETIDALAADGPLVLRVGTRTSLGTTSAFEGTLLLDIDPDQRDDASSGRDAGSSTATAMPVSDGELVGHLGPGDPSDVFALPVERAQLIRVTLRMPPDAVFALNGFTPTGTTITLHGIDSYARPSHATIVVSRTSGHGDYVLDILRDPGTGPAPPPAPLVATTSLTGIAATAEGVAFTNETGVWSWAPTGGARRLVAGPHYGLRAVGDGLLTNTIIPNTVVTKIDESGPRSIVPGRVVQGPDAEGNVYFWNWSTGLHRRTPAGVDQTMVQPCDVEQGLLRCYHLLGFAPDGKVYGWRDLGEVLHEVDLTTGAHSPVFTVPGLRIAGLAFGTDGAVYVAGAHTGYVLRWLPADGTYATVARTADTWIQAIAADEDALYVATYNDTTRVGTIGSVPLAGTGFPGFRPTIGDLPRQDLRVASVAVAPGALPTERRILVTVANEGEAATPPVKLRVWEGVPSGGTNQTVAALASPRWDAWVPAIGPGASATIELAWDTRQEAGEQWLRASVDETGFLSDEAVAEVDEKDNVLYQRVVLHVDAAFGT